MFRERRRLGAVVSGSALCLAFALPAVATGDTVYRWVDEGGVVHFADSPPTGKQEYEERVIGPAPITRRETDTNAAPAGTTGDTATAGETTSAKAETQASGPARVILTSQSALARGADARHLVGIVKNVGGETALRVRITAHVADRNGNECQNEDVDVVPSELEPGETGNFDTTLSSPCFVDGGSVDAEARWD